MIRYTLACDRDHTFEAWFASGDAYDAAAKAGANACPVCGSTRVEKALMAPAVSAATRRGKTAPDAPSANTAPAGRGESSGDKVDVVAADPRREALRAALRELRKRVVASSEDVGERFPEEARKIHYEEVEPRGIYGKATPEEARELLEEGVEVMPLPSLPEEKN